MIISEIVGKKNKKKNTLAFFFRMNNFKKESWQENWLAYSWARG